MTLCDENPIPTSPSSTIFKKSLSLFFFVIFFESSKPFIISLDGRITAAATTGPAKAPLPASSIPQFIFIKKITHIFVIINIYIMYFSFNQ